MPLDLTIAQAVVFSDSSGPAVAATSDPFPDALHAAVLDVATRFGPRPPGVDVPAAVFVVPLLRAHIAVVQMADRPGNALGFRFLVLTRRLYEAIGDPFLIADRFPPDWSARGPLHLLEWPPDPLPPRTVAEVAQVLKDGDGPFLLGATQGLLDGVRVVLVRPAPDEAVVRSLWKLLPTRSRGELWPATFAFNLDLGFHLAVLPAAPTPLPPGTVTEEQAKDYPQGRYELALQIAAEDGNQRDIDRLFARRTSRDTLRLAILILIGAVLAAVASKFFS